MHSGLSAEELKRLRRKVKADGFNYQLGENGWFYFSGLYDNVDWKKLDRHIFLEKSIIPLYFETENRKISYHYGKKCLESNLQYVVSKTLLHNLKVCLNIGMKQRIQYLLKLKELK